MYVAYVRAAQSDVVAERIFDGSGRVTVATLSRLLGDLRLPNLAMGT